MLLSVIFSCLSLSLLAQPVPPDPPPPGYCAPNQRPPRWGGWFPLSTYPSRSGASVGVAGNCPRSYCGDGRLVIDPQHTAADRWMTGCWLADTGKPLDCSICFTTWVDPEDSLLTGHSHDLSREEFPDRMLITRGVVWSELDYQRRPFRTSTGFHGRTSSTGYATIATAPEVGTIVRFSIWARAHDGPVRNFSYWFICHPANWATSYLCVPPYPPDLRFYMPKEEYLDGFWHFHVPGLERLAEGPDLPYILCDYFSCCRKNDGSSSGNPPHPEPFWVTRELQGVINHVGRKFQARVGTDVKLLVGDASLKDGGLLGICGGWNPPHARHRLGRSADITLKSVYAREGDTWHVRPTTQRELRKFRESCPAHGVAEVPGVGSVHFTCKDEGDHSHVHVELLPLIPANPRHPPCPEIPLEGEVCLPFFPE